MTEHYEVSRGPVREALNRLAAMGVVELPRQRGAQIRILTLDEAIDSLVVAQGLVGMAARLAAESDSDKQRLQEALAELMRFDQTSPTAEYALARDAFYSVLSALADNAALSRVMMQVHIHLIRAQFRSVLRTVDRSRHKDYIDITEAVVAGDAKKAERTARAHLARPLVALRGFRDKNETS